MRCKACDAVLSEIDMARKCPETKEFLDLCTRCYNISERVLDNTFIEPPEYVPGNPGLSEAVQFSD